MADHLARLKQAIVIVVKRQLKENHDDTLTEKLISHVRKLLRSGNSLDREEHNQLLHLIVQLLSHTSPDPVSLRLLALFLSSDNVFQSPTEATELALEKFAAAATCIDASSDLSLQAALIQSLTMFTDTDWLVTGQLYSLPPVSFPRIIYNLMIHSPSYFVRNDCEQLLAKLFSSNRVCSDMGRSTQSVHLTEIMQLITANPDAKHLQFLKLVLEKTMTTRASSMKANMQEAVFKQFEEYSSSEPLDEKIFHLFCHILGMFVLRPDSVDKVFSICLKRCDLKGLVIFSSRLLQVDREYINKWLLYSLYALVARSERRGEIAEQMLASLREKAFVERHADNSVIMTVLNLMPIVFRNVDEKGALIVEALHVFLQTKLADARRLFENRKIISEAIVCLFKCSQEDLVVEGDFNEILCNLIVISESSYCHTIELLTIARNFWKAKLLFHLFGSMTVLPILDSMSQLLSRDRFHQPIQNWTEDDDSSEKDMEVLELSFDALSHLTGNAAFGEHPKFMHVLLSLWNLHKDNLTFLTAAIPVLFALDTLATEQELNKFGWCKHVDIPALVCSSLKQGDDCLTLKIVSTLKDNTERMSYLKSKKPEAFDEILSALCFACLRAVESELQIETFSFLLDILNPGSKDDLKSLYSCGLMTTAMLVVESDLFSSNDVRITAFEISELIRLCIQCESLNESSLAQLLQDAPHATIFESLSVEADNQALKVSNTADKVEVIDTLFQGFASQPTQDMILELNDRQDDLRQNTNLPSICVSGMDFGRLVKFYTGGSHYAPNENLSDCIIDDILAAKESANAAAIDCY